MQQIYAREGTREDFDRFCIYSMHVRYLGTPEAIGPHEVLEDYIRLFLDRPILPRVRSINIRMLDAKFLQYLLRSSTPAENQPSSSASTLSSLTIYHTLTCDLYFEEGHGLARDVLAFQHSNRKLGGGIDTYQDFHPFPCRSHYRSLPPGFWFQASMENAFTLPPEDADLPSHGLRRLEVAHYLRELPAFFGRVAKMRALEHLKISIAHRGNMWEAEGEDKAIQQSVSSGIQHSVSSLEIEGIWSDLYAAIYICPPPLAAGQLRAFRLHYYLSDIPTTQAKAVQVLDLPAGIIPPDDLEALTVELLDSRERIRKYGRGPTLMVNAFRPLLRYRQLVKLHLDLPCNNRLDIEFFHAVGAVMGGTLRHLVVLRALTPWFDHSVKPVLTADDLPTIAGVIMPRLETLGLDVRYCKISSSAKRDSSVVSPLLGTLYVGTIILRVQQIPQVAEFLKRHFPGLQRLYHHPRYHREDPWQCVMELNGYTGGFYGPGEGF